MSPPASPRPRPVRAAEPARGGASADVQVDDAHLLLALSGPGGEHLRAIEREVGVVVGLRGDTIRLSGARADVDLAERVLADLLALAERGRDLDERDVLRAARTL